MDEVRGGAREGGAEGFELRPGSVEKSSRSLHRECRVSG